MRFIIPYSYGTNLEQSFANARELQNSLNDGQHDIFLMSVVINQAPINTATYTVSGKYLRINSSYAIPLVTGVF